MPVAGERPESGVRIVLERARGEAPPFPYTGQAHVPSASYALRAVVAEDGQVEVTLDAAPGDAEPPADLAEKVRLIVRTVAKQAKSDGVAPPLRIVRWRGEK